MAPSSFRNVAGTWEIRTLAVEPAVRIGVAALALGPADTEVAALGAGFAASEPGAAVRTGAAALGVGVAASEPGAELHNPPPVHRALAGS